MNCVVNWLTTSNIGQWVLAAGTVVIATGACVYVWYAWLGG